MKVPFIIALILITSGLSFYQSEYESDIDQAYLNAKKGIYWALENIPEKKSKAGNNLIADDRLYSSVKLTKGVNGIKIESTGYHNSNEVTIKIFRSNESLEQDGFLKRKENPENKKD
jgi:hypothetical protein